MKPWKFKSVVYYIDEESGEMIKNFNKKEWNKKLIEKTSQNLNNGTAIIEYIYGCRKKPKQIELDF